MCQTAAPTYKLLKERIIERYQTISHFAHIVGLSNSAMSYILSGKNALTQQNMQNFAEKLGIPYEKYYDYFFT